MCAGRVGGRGAAIEKSPGRCKSAGAFRMRGGCRDDVAVRANRARPERRAARPGYFPAPKTQKSRSEERLFCLAAGMSPQLRIARDAITYFALASATAVSSMRFEKPHSLSYQLDTFTRRPDTLVSVASNVDEAGLWLKSIDTSGASL
jgi:hypothetical protein